MNSPLVVLIVMDGWGIAPAGPGNPIMAANLPNIRKFWAGYPHTTLLASGEAVGLPRGEVGNTETGHLNLGAGRIVYQDLLRINMSIANGAYFSIPAFLEAIEHVKKNNSRLHLMGLVGGGGSEFVTAINLAGFNYVDFTPEIGYDYYFRCDYGFLDYKYWSQQRSKTSY